MNEQELLLEIKKKLNGFITKNHYKQKVFRAILNCEKSTVSELLHGSRNIDIVEYKKICDYFNVPLDYFMPGKD